MFRKHLHIFLSGLFTGSLAAQLNAECILPNSHGGGVIVENNKILGFVLSPVTPGEMTDLLGFRNGDILIDANGIPFTNPEKLKDIFADMRAGIETRFKIRRRARYYLIRIQINTEYFNSHLDCTCICKAKRDYQEQKAFKAKQITPL